MTRYLVPRLPFNPDELAPFLDSTSVHDHLLIHKQYADKLNETLMMIGGASHPQHVSSILSDMGSVPADARDAVGFFGGGYENHRIFWDSVIPGGGDPGRLLGDYADVYFGGVDQMIDVFSERAASVHGSGWCWLVFNTVYHRIEITTTPNETSPWSARLVPLLGLDMWEHAYYLRHAFDRGSYIREWWNVVNWDHVEDRLEAIG